MKKTLLYLGCFFLAFFLRACIIYLTPTFQYENIDLQIYRDTGQLVANGINPYDYTDNVELRNQLRTDKDCYNEYTCENQERWNFCANSNLPLATLFFGAVEYLFASALAYRLFFAFFDSLLAVLILAFVLNKWQFKLSNNFIVNKISPKLLKLLLLLIGLFLGAISFIIMLNGTWLPEHKGMGLLLVLSSIYFSDSSKKANSLILSPVLLGCSVSFIGLSVFIAPLCLYNIYKNYNFKMLFFYSVISLVFCLIWLVPFLPQLFTMMSERLSDPNYIPIHGSMWVPFYKLFPGKWILFKHLFMILFVVINILGLIRKRLNIIIISASLIYFFTDIYLIAGSMNRMNIALLTVILLIGYSKYFNMAVLLSVLYIIYGCFSFLYTFIIGYREDFDGYFMLIFSGIYFLFLIFQTFGSQQILKIQTKPNSIYQIH